MPHNEQKPVWTPISFPSAVSVPAPQASLSFEKLVIPPVSIGTFHSTKSLKQLAEKSALQGTPLNCAEIEASGQAAWAERSPAFALTVSRDSLNFLGRAFGGNIIDWHLRAATAGALQISNSPSQMYTARVIKGVVSFATPLFYGDEVRGYVEAVDIPTRSVASTQPFSSLYRVHLVAKRERGFSEAPLTILEVGSSELEILHTPHHQDRFRRYKSLKGFDIARIVTNNHESCRQNTFGTPQTHEGIARRSSQLTAAADIRFYVAAREILGGDRERDPIVTRNFYVHFLDRAYEQTSARNPLTFKINHTGEVKTVMGNQFLKLGGAILAGEKELASVSATMVRLGRKKEA